MQSWIPNVAPVDIITAPSVATRIAVVTIRAQMKSIPQTNVTCPVTFAHPVIQLARGAYFGGANFAEKYVVKAGACSLWDCAGFNYRLGRELA